LVPPQGTAFEPLLDWLYTTVAPPVRLRASVVLPRLAAPVVRPAVAAPALARVVLAAPVLSPVRLRSVVPLQRLDQEV
jgi:hypothetical protein